MDKYHPDSNGDRVRRCSHDTPNPNHPVAIKFEARTEQRKGAPKVAEHKTAMILVRRNAAYAGAHFRQVT